MCFILGKTLRMVETENGKFQSCAEFNKFCVAEQRLCIEMCYQRHFAHCSDMELGVEMSCQT